MKIGMVSNADSSPAGDVELSVKVIRKSDAMSNKVGDG
jgi:hypothetical protein